MPKVPNMIKVRGHLYVKADKDREELIATFLNGIRANKSSLKTLLNEMDTIAAEVKADPEEFVSRLQRLGVMGAADSFMNVLNQKYDMLKELLSVIENYKPGERIPHIDAFNYFSTTR